MDLKEIATVPGKGGLFKVIKPTRGGVILESIDDSKTRIVATVSHKVSLLDEISVYTTSAGGSKPISEIFKKIFDEFDDDPGVDKKSSPDELKAFLEYILPEYDPARVYVSDIKKLVTWYHILIQNIPDLFKDNSDNEEKGKDTETGS